ncbi:MAG TPA: sugar transferase [Acidimicrobiales bacterium]|nr:sugar transferase [Acidimicrobiales bacterium]
MDTDPRVPRRSDLTGLPAVPGAVPRSFPSERLSRTYRRHRAATYDTTSSATQSDVKAAPAATRRRPTAPRLVLIDTLAALLSLFVGFAILEALGRTAHVTVAWALCGTAIVVAALALVGSYRPNALRTVPTGMPVFTNVIHALPIMVFGVLVALLASGLANGRVALRVAVVIVLPTVLYVPLFRSVASRIGRRQWRLSPAQQVLIVGSGELADRMVSALYRYNGIHVIGVVDDDPPPGYTTIGKVKDLPRLCREQHVDRLIVTMPTAPGLAVTESLHSLLGTVDIAIVPSFYELVTWRSGCEDVAGLPLVPLQPAQHGVARLAKRAMDLVVATLALLVTAPIWMAAAVAVKATSPGPVLFRQDRAGRDTRPFRIFKFRTMYVDAEERKAELLAHKDTDGAIFKMAVDPRVTPVGRFLRRFSIDELPQLLNVLAGQMSLVGPRPFPLDEAEALTSGNAAARFEVLPGMTGVWQVSGRSDLTWDDLCRLDAIYVRSWSIWWDIRILLKTPWVALRRQGAY